jgi:hypothetical protein
MDSAALRSHLIHPLLDSKALTKLE